jgi:hypothetical protein
MIYIRVYLHHACSVLFLRNRTSNRTGSNTIEYVPTQYSTNYLIISLNSLLLDFPCIILIIALFCSQLQICLDTQISLYILKGTIFWDITPCSPLRFNRRFGGTYRLHLQGRKNKPSKKPEGKQVEALCSPETSVDSQRTTRRCIQEDVTRHNHRCENLRSCKSTY